MQVDFFGQECKHTSCKSTFGICDDIASKGAKGQPAYLDETNGERWIATVDNFYCSSISFYAIDHCVSLPVLAKNKSVKRCDGVLTCENTIAFVELKSRNQFGSKWIKIAEGQLRSTIHYFEQEPESVNFSHKRAYAINNLRPMSRIGQAQRMERFVQETGYQLFIKARIDLYSAEG